MQKSFLSAFKSFCRPLFPESCWTYIRYFIYRLMKRDRFSINEIDKKLERYLPYKNGFYVELGANDGFSQSNTFYLEKRKHWNGVLIEPCLNLFLEALYYRGRRNKIFCNACVPFDYKNEFVSVEWGNFRTRSISLESDIIDVLEFDGERKDSILPGSRNVVFGAQARTLTSLLDESGAPKKIDLLSLDVEGAELSVLQGVDFKRYSFEFILVECRDIERLSAFLSLHKYFLIDQLSGHDYLFSK